MSGLILTPRGPVVERAVAFLAAAPADSVTLAREVLGLPAAGQAVADRVARALLGAHPGVRRLADGRWSLAASGAAPRAPVAALTFAVVDVETTGNRPAAGDRIVEIAVATLAGGRARLVLDRLVNPCRPIPSAVRDLTRITDRMVRDEPAFEDIADEVARALSGRVFVAHNARFDWAFVTGELRRARALELEGPRLCTVRLARRLVPGLRHRELDSVARYFGIAVAGRHRAGGDALAAARILARLLELAAERGIATLDELAALAARRAPRRRRRTAAPRSVDEA